MVTKLKSVSFYHDDENRYAMDYTMPFGDSARIKMYDRVIQAFDHGLDSFQGVTDLMDEWR